MLNEIYKSHPEASAEGSAKLIIWLLMGVLSFGTACNLNEPKPGKQVLITEGLSGNLIDGYWVYLPKNFDQTKSYPIILFLSGGAGVSSHKGDTKEEGPSKFAIQEMVDPVLTTMLQDSFIILNPHMDIGPPETRAWRHHSETLFNIVDEIANKYSGDLDRLIVTGLSHGGAGTWDLLKEHSHRISAAVAIGGPIRCEQNCDAFGDTPFWVIHNTGDNVIPIRYPDEAIEYLLVNNELEAFELHEINMVPKSKFVYSFINKDGHDAWNAAYSNPNIYTWLLEQTRD
jgi:predicted peptidase